ncbi:unnamed protein product [Hermetia illucens]|nr:unnamed protein product [Hermetia illucens]
MQITKFNPLVYFRSSAMEFSDVRHVVVFSIADHALHHPSGVVESSCLSLRQVKYYNGGPDFNSNGMHLVMYTAYNYVNCKEVRVKSLIIICLICEMEIPAVIINIAIICYGIFRCPARCGFFHC